MNHPQEDFAPTPARGGGRVGALPPHRARYWLGLILLAGLLLRLAYISEPPSGYMIWRQTQTLMVSRNFYEGSMNLLRPAVDWNTTEAARGAPVVGGTELQVIPWLTAFLYHGFGVQDWVGRVLPIFFSVIGLYYFYRFAGRIYREKTALAATALLCVSPLFLYVGRLHVPEPFAFAMAFAALYYYDYWLERPSWGSFLLAVLSCLFTLLGKPPLGLIALPMAWLTLARFGVAFWKQGRLYAFAALVGLPVLAFVYYSNHILTAESGISFAQPQLLGYSQLKKASYYAFLWHNILDRAVGPSVTLIAFLGFFCPGRARRGWVVYAWLAAAILFFFLMPGGNRANGYYQLMITPPACLLAGRLIALIWGQKRLAFLGSLILLGLLAHSFLLAQPLFASRQGEAERACGAWLDRQLPEEALVLTLTPDCSTLYFSNRKGWTCWRENYGEHIPIAPKTIEKVRNLGAQAVAIPEGDVFDNALNPRCEQYHGVAEYLYDRYYCYRTDEFAVFLLNRKADLTAYALTFDSPNDRRFLRGGWGPTQSTQQLDTFVGLGPEKSASLCFEVQRGQRHAVLEVASTLPEQPLVIQLNGKEVARETLKDPWRHHFIILPLERRPVGQRHTITLETGKQAENRMGLLLYTLRVEGGMPEASR